MKQKNPELARLQKIWYQKLKDEGFDDIEYNYENSDSYNIKNWPVVESIPQHRIENNTQYYRLAGFFLHDYNFSSKTEELTWSLHAEGKSYREIASILKKLNIKKKRQAVFNLIAKLKAEMFKLYGNNK